jgi:hypothetical protein
MFMVANTIRSNQTTNAMKKIEPIFIVLAIAGIVVGIAIINIFL